LKWRSIILLFVFGIVEFGRALMVQQMVTNCAREAARRCILDGSSNAAVIQTTKDLAAGGLNVDQSKFNVTIAVNGTSGSEVGNAVPGDLCAVSIDVAYDDVRLFPASYLGARRLVGRSTMHHE
jgi:Flp pilus assembly protein TadG